MSNDLKRIKLQRAQIQFELDVLEVIRKHKCMSVAEINEGLATILHSNMVKIVLYENGLLKKK